MKHVIQFVGGGTAGHIAPALAVADALKDMCRDVEVKFVVSGRDTELKCLAGTGVHVDILPTDGWNKSIIGKLSFVAKAPLAAYRASTLYSGRRPGVVVGMGGYASVVPVLVAQARGIPTMLFESNSVPGRVTRLLSRFADEVQLQFESARDRIYRRKGIVTGNPVRKRIFSGDVHRARERFGLSPSKQTVLVMGGSQGALELNRRVCETLPLLESEADRLQVIHLTGQADEKRTRDAYAATPIQHFVAGYLEAMEDAYALADLAVCRAGGSSLAELNAIGIPSILVPYPFAADRHQLFNAMELVRCGAAWLIEQENLTPGVLAHSIRTVLGEREILASMKQASLNAGRRDAARVVAGRILCLAGIDVDKGENVSDSYSNQVAA